MKTFAVLGFLAAAAGAAVLSPASSLAMPLAAPGASAGSVEPLIIQAQSHRRARVYRSGPRVVYRNRGYNRGAVIGGAAALGVLGAAAVAAPYYYNRGAGCYIEQRPVYDSWGQYMGVQNVRVCQ